MEKRLSANEIATFQGNVLPLRLLGDKEFCTDTITWCCDNENVVQITEFSQNYRYGGEFTNGVLLTFLKVGEATVTATQDEKTYTCKVSVRAMRRAESSPALNYYVGDMHDHTCDEHTIEGFSNRDASFYPINCYMPHMKKDNRMDFAVVSDHASVLNARDFFRGYSGAEDIGDDVIFLPGAEGQVTQREKDRYGIEHMHGGEILMFNADTGYNVESWDSFFQGLKTSPFAVCGFPHPQIIGFSVKGIWDFRHRENNSKRFTDLFRFTEIGNGTNECTNMLQEYVYSAALDEGFHLSPTCSSDGHIPEKWGYHSFPGKTVIMAPEKSKEAFLDAIRENRMYATSSGNVKLFYSVNGKAAPVTLNNEGAYRFHVSVSYFRVGEEDTFIRKCKVITDKGIALLELENMGDTFDFTVFAPDSHWFYLVLIDGKGRKTWSCPVWTGKKFERKTEPKLRAIDKKGMQVFDRVSGAEVPVVINDNPLDHWQSEYTTADLIFDLGKETKICAVSHFPKWMEALKIREEGLLPKDKVKAFPSMYRVSVSADGGSWERVAFGHFRIFGWEETIRFAQRNARYLRLEILSTVGKEWERPKFADSTLAIAELTLWQEE